MANAAPDIGDDISKDFGGDKLPFLTAGNYEVEVDGTDNWSGATDGMGRWRINYTVIQAEGPSATPVGTKSTFLIKQDPNRLTKYHAKDLQRVTKAAFDMEASPTPAELKSNLQLLLADKGKAVVGRRMGVQVTPSKSGFPQHFFFGPSSVESTETAA